MDPNALLMDGRDNVVTCIKDISAGEEIVYYLEGERKTLRAEEAIPFCHKASLRDIAPGEDVLKYGERIGRATAFIQKGIMTASLSQSRRIRSPRNKPLGRTAGSGFGATAGRKAGPEFATMC